MTRVCVVTVGRSDFGIYRPLLRRLLAEPDFELQIIAAGMHFSSIFGDTLQEIENDGFEIAARVEMAEESDRPIAVARTMGRGLVGFAEAYEALAPDFIVILGDRFEMHAAVGAAIPFLVPVAHIAGGTLSAGAIDDSLRHSITKLSSLHFVEVKDFARRVIQMGEEPWRITVTGSLGLDNIIELDSLSRAELEAHVGLTLDPPPLLVTFHPVTREYHDTRRQIDALIAALEQSGRPAVITYPNADTEGRTIIERIEALATRCPTVRCVPHLGTRAYFGLMRHAAAMVGNSSSGLIEAASFALPVVNVGNRQEGRLAPANVIHCGNDAHEIHTAIGKATSAAFRAGLTELKNPYGDGRAAERMIAVLRETDPKDPRLIKKRFCDLATS